MSDILKKKTGSNSLWIFFQTLTTRIVGFLSQLVLVWIFEPELFGSLAIINSFTNFGLIIYSTGISDILIRSPRSYFHWFKTSKSLLIFFSFILQFTISCFAILILGFDEIEILILIGIHTLSIPLNALSVLPDTKLRINLNFKILSKIAIWEQIGNQIITILLALLGFQLYSFIIPVIFTSLTKAIWINFYVNQKIVSSFSFKRWKVLLSKSSYIFTDSLFQRLITHIDYLILGLFTSKENLGIYFFSFLFGTQYIQVFSTSITSVIFPTSIKFLENRNNSLLTLINKITTFLCITAIPILIWQIIYADEIIYFFFHEKWSQASTILPIMTLATVFKVVSAGWYLPFKVQADFKTLLKLTFFSLLTLVILLFPFSYYYKIKGAAYALLIHSVLIYPLFMSFCYKRIGGSLKKTAISFFVITFYSFISFSLPKMIYQYFIYEKFISFFPIFISLSILSSYSCLVATKIFFPNELQFLVSTISKKIKF